MQLTWGGFEQANGSNSRSRFEDLCYEWFVNEISKDKRRPHQNKNHAGIECEPVLSNDNEITGFQAKYFDINKVDYSQFRDSLAKISDRERGQLECVYLCSNRSINDDNDSYEAICNQQAQFGIIVKKFSDKDILLWAQRNIEIAGDYWNLPLLKIDSKIDIMQEGIDNNGIEIQKLKYLFLEKMSGEMKQDSPDTMDNKDFSNTIDDEAGERLQYVIPKEILSKIDRTIQFFQQLVFGYSEQECDSAGDLDEFAHCFLQILFCCKNIKHFNIALFLESLKEIVSDHSLYQVISLRWQAIQAHYRGDIEQSILFMQEALSEAEKTQQPTWFIQDILIDLRNEDLEKDIISNKRHKSDAQTKLDEIKVDLHYPILDRQRKAIYERCIMDMFKSKASSPQTIEWGSDLDLYVKEFATSYIIALYNGSLTHLRLIYRELRLFFYHCCERYDDWYFRYEMFKMATMGEGRKVLDEIVQAYPEIVGKCTCAEAYEILTFCSNEPLEYKRIIKQLNVLRYIGYLLTDEQFSHCITQLLTYIHYWISDENRCIEVGNAIFPCLTSIALRLEQDELANICCEFIDANCRIWDKELFKFMRTSISIDELHEEVATNLIAHIIELIKNEDYRKKSLNGSNSYFLCMFRRQSYSRTKELNHIIEKYMPEFYNNEYQLETVDNNTEFMKKYLEQIVGFLQVEDKSQGQYGVYSDASLYYWRTLNAILLDREVSITVDLLEKVTKVSVDILGIPDIAIEVKLIVMNVLVTLAARELDFFKKVVDIKEMYNSIYSTNETKLNSSWDTNVTDVALKASVTILACLTGLERSLDMTMLFPKLNESPASLIAVQEVIIQIMKSNDALLFPEPLSNFVLNSSVFWLDSEKILVKRKACHIILLLLRNKSYIKVICPILEELFDTQDQYVKNMIQKYVYENSIVPGEFKKKISEKSKNNPHFVVRYVYKKEYLKNI